MQDGRLSCREAAVLTYFTNSLRTKSYHLTLHVMDNL